MSRNSKIIMFAQLNFFTLIIALGLRIFGFKVYYDKLTVALSNLTLFNLLRLIGVEGVSYEALAQKTLYDYHAELYKDIHEVYQTYVEQCSIKNIMIQHFAMDEVAVDKLNIALKSAITHRIRPFFQLIYFAEDLHSKTNSKIYLFAPNDKFTRIVQKNKKVVFSNLCPSLLTWAVNVLNLLLRLSKILLRLVKTKFKFKRNAKPHTEVQNNSPSCNIYDHDVLYFPHCGIFFGNLYKKDHFYSPDINDPFHASKIVHLSMGETGSVIDQSIEYYSQHNIPFDDFFNILRSSRTNSIKSFLKFIWKNSTPILNAIIKEDFSSIKFYLKNIYQLHAYMCAIQQFKDVKVALIGYDILFPLWLSFAFKLCNVKTAAVQERMLILRMFNFHLNFDYYFVDGPVTKKFIEDNDDIFAIENVIVSGSVRLDLAFKEAAHLSYGEKYTQIKKNYFVMLVMDAHSAPDERSNRTSFLNHWKNNKKFYQDIIRLSLEFPHVYFVIKGKNTDVCDNINFTDIMDVIDTLPNIEIEKDLDQFTPYKMINIADAAIALHTSLGDEMLASGKPVLFYDFIGIPTPFFDYDGYPIIVYDYEGLKTRLKEIVNENKFMKKEEFLKMRKHLFGDNFDGRIKERLHEEMLQAYKSMCVPKFM